ncbi:MAG TPA: hypothetical protein PLB01_02065 [Thermoanaerobaculia bacterium]|nr:hypothetical protein [Thermoanaerobaculia bacterium]
MIVRLPAILFLAGAAACLGAPAFLEPPVDEGLRVEALGVSAWTVAGDTPRSAGDAFRSPAIRVRGETLVLGLLIEGEVARGGISYRFEDEAGRLLRPDGQAGPGRLTDCALAVRADGRPSVRLVLANPADGGSRWKLSRVEVRQFREFECPGCARRLEERFSLGRSAWLWAWGVLRSPAPRGDASRIPECACAGVRPQAR